MKLDFMNLLRDKSATPEAIAEQIVALERKRSQCEKTRSESKARIKELRRLEMCGEKVDADAIRAAEKAFDGAAIDSEIVTESFAELNGRLRAALLEQREKESGAINGLHTELVAAQKRLEREKAKAEGRLYGILSGIYSNMPGAIRDAYPALFERVTNLPGSPYPGDFILAKEQAMAELQRPTPAEQEASILRKSAWVGAFNLEAEQEALLQKCRVVTPAGV